MGVGADGGGGAGVEGKDDEVAAGAGGGPVAAHRRPLQQALHRIPGRPLLGAGGGRRRDPRPGGADRHSGASDGGTVIGCCRWTIRTIAPLLGGWGAVAFLVI